MRTNSGPIPDKIRSSQAEKKAMGNIGGHRVLPYKNLRGALRKIIFGQIDRLCELLQEEFGIKSEHHRLRKGPGQHRGSPYKNLSGTPKNFFWSN